MKLDLPKRYNMTDFCKAVKKALANEKDPYKRLVKARKITVESGNGMTYFRNVKSAILTKKEWPAVEARVLKQGYGKPEWAEDTILNRFFHDKKEKIQVVKGQPTKDVYHINCDDCKFYQVILTTDGGEPKARELAAAHSEKQKHTIKVFSGLYDEFEPKKKQIAVFSYKDESDVENMVDTHEGNMVTKIVDKMRATSKKQCFESYKEHSEEFRKRYGLMLKNEDKAYELFNLMVRDLTGTGMSTGQAVDKIAEDHKGLQRFSRASLYRHLPADIKRPYMKKHKPELPVPDVQTSTSVQGEDLTIPEESEGEQRMMVLEGVPDTSTQLSRPESPTETIADMTKLLVNVPGHPEIITQRYKVFLVCGHIEISFTNEAEKDLTDKINKMYCETCNVQRERDPFKVVIKEIVIDQGEAEKAKEIEALEDRIRVAKKDEVRMRDLAQSASANVQRLEKENRELKLKLEQVGTAQ